MMLFQRFGKDRDMVLPVDASTVKIKSATEILLKFFIFAVMYTRSISSDAVARPKHRVRSSSGPIPIILSDSSEVYRNRLSPAAITYITRNEVELVCKECPTSSLTVLVWRCYKPSCATGDHYDCI